MSEILIADDEESVRATIGAHLRKAGFTVDEAKTGEETMAMLTSGGYKLIFLDFIMSRGSGRDVLRFLPTLPRPPKCVVISALAVSLRKGGAVPKGITILEKPFEASLAVMIANRMIRGVGDDIESKLG